ncbi:4-amino-4-deoxy-L-arabinose transferase [Actinokineospora alba]|uniref:4-amino-4-deoxy-L-arabinose transferase n=1 Tax=Actinokineospora alba TaxID=504798 RepID=A0A1H0FJ36_9PSEU|nr:glycosyltransferase family 39 protein [Actinokineospora alba]TDP69499.1 4-amino-4-deoxy-L-arabinose transferase-like glycosyltransferase [Actinokineospora alba]SDI15407.1 4-amino-4-deoxy-L-arabinose transferase [Actinokineospora alba]SDN94620.1 4-amino-4-deoxy-L-arabinose transferase [Actinokineospora alba]
MTQTAEPPVLPRGHRAALVVLLLATAALYCWDLGASGWANAYYSAAAQAGSQDWSALLFAATDPAGGITVDKTPAAVWLMGLSVRVFGLSAWSVLLPQALAGVGSVWLLHNTVRRWSGPTAGLIAGVVLAVTPVAALMFRFNNPDALLVLLLIAGAYCTVRAVEHASPKWIVLAGAAVGFGFLTKMMQAFLVLPAFAVVYLVAAPTTVGRRIAHLGAAAGAMIVAGGWWVLLAELLPSGSRPYIGGSQTDSVLELALGYNGIGRLDGDEVGSVGGGAGWGQPGWARLFGGEMGDGIAWLLPAALIVLGGGLWLTRRAPRTDTTRAALLLWGLWLLVSGAVFSLMAGIIHGYYTVALAPAVAALVGIGTVTAWRRRREPAAAAVLAAATAVTAVQAALLLGQVPDWVPWLRAFVLFGGLGAAALLAVAPLAPKAYAGAVAVGALVLALAAPAAYSLATAAQPHSGALPSPGPATTGGLRFAGGLLGAPTPGEEVVEALRADAAGYRWAAAVVGSNNAAGYQLAAGVPVLAVGGFNGTDPAPTLDEFVQLVADGRIHWFISGSTMRGETGSDAAQRIAEWVAQHHTPTTVDGVTLYDLSR